jgi:hypothetical protein
MTPLKHYVCDRCANYWQAYRSSRCPACRAERLWEFPDEAHARQHAADIVDPSRSVRPL